MDTTKERADEVPTTHESLGRWVFLVVLALGASLLVNARTGALHGRPLVYSAAFLFGQTLGMLVVPGVVSLFFRKSRRFAVRLVGLAIFAIVPLFLAPRRSTEAEDLIGRLNRRNERLRGDAQAQIAERGYYVADPDQISAGLDEIRAAAGGSDDEQLEVMAALLSVQEEMAAVVAAKMEAVSAMNALGPINTAESRDDVRAMKDAVEACQRAHERFAEFMSTCVDRCAAALEETETSAAARRDAMAGFRDGANLDLVMDAVANDTAILEARWQTCDLVEESWEALSLQDDQLLFEDPTLAERFNALQGEIATLSARQVEVQRRMLGRAR
jgi:hypothetical protein